MGVALVAALGLSSCGSTPHKAAAHQTTTTTAPPTTTTTTAPPATTSTIGSTFITPSAAPSHLGETETVRFYVARTYTDSDGTEFLDQCQNYASCFVVTIYASDLASFPSDPASTYLYDTVDVTGTISYYGGYYEILNPTGIQVAN